MTRPASPARVPQAFWISAGSIVLIRIACLVFADGDLGPDEAQYWFWAQDLDFGYFSKPPMIAWLIAATTALFGDGEWAVRLAAPLLHGGTSAFIALTAARLFGPRAALAAGLGWLTLPGVALSSALITTDAPLLFFWSAALYLYFRITGADRPSTVDFALLGAAIGLGLLSKYAMIYFLIALPVILVAAPAARARLLRPGVVLTGLAAAALFAPNVLWNAAHDFQTVSHTAANAHWTASLFKPAALAEFLGGQFFIFGIVLFPAFLVAAYLSRRSREADRIALLVFALTPLAIVCAQAFISRAHANWAAAAYPAALILATGVFLEAGRARWMEASLALNATIAVAVAVGLLNFALLDRLGAGRAVKELRGWRAMSEEIAAAARAEPYDAILFDDRSMIAEMLYYQRGGGFEIAALDPNNSVSHHFEAFLSFRPDDHRRSLFVSIRPDDAHVNYRFSQIDPRGRVIGDLGGAGTRLRTLYAIEGYTGPPGVQRDKP